MITSKVLQTMNIHTDICGWYDVKKMEDILDFIKEIDDNLDTHLFDEYGGYDETIIRGYEIILTGDGREYDVDIIANGHTLAECESNVLLDAIATAVMHLNGYKGNFSVNKIAKIIEVMKASNLEHSDFFNNQWDS